MEFSYAVSTTNVALGDILMVSIWISNLLIRIVIDICLKEV